MIIGEPEAARHVLKGYGDLYAKGLVAEVSEFLFGSGFAIAEGELWTVSVSHSLQNTSTLHICGRSVLSMRLLLQSNHMLSTVWWGLHYSTLCGYLLRTMCPGVLLCANGYP